MFTNKLFNTIVTETNRYYQQHSQDEEKKLCNQMLLYLKYDIVSLP
jgi:hypothetical protein